MTPAQEIWDEKFKEYHKEHALSSVQEMEEEMFSAEDIKQALKIMGNNKKILANAPSTHLEQSVVSKPIILEKKQLIGPIEREQENFNMHQVVEAR